MAYLRGKKKERERERKTKSNRVNVENILFLPSKMQILDLSGKTRQPEYVASDDRSKCWVQNVRNLTPNFKNPLQTSPVLCRAQSTVFLPRSIYTHRPPSYLHKVKELDIGNTASSLYYLDAYLSKSSITDTFSYNNGFNFVLVVFTIGIKQGQTLFH